MKNVENVRKIAESSTDIIKTVVTRTTRSTLTVNSITNGESISNSALVPVDDIVGEAVVGQKRLRDGKLSFFWAKKPIVFFHFHQ